MKTQSWGLKLREIVSEGIWSGRERGMFPTGPANYPWGAGLANVSAEYDTCNGVPEYLMARSNGSEVDAPSQKFPRDGTLSWEPPSRRLEVRYKEGYRDRAWMEERDRNYVFRLLREGTLDVIEPNLATEVPALYAEIVEARRILAAEVSS